MKNKNDKPYLIFVLGYDLLNDMYKCSDSCECDLCYEFSEKIVDRFMQTNEYQEKNSSVYKVLEDWIEEKKSLIENEYKDYIGTTKLYDNEIEIDLTDNHFEFYNKNEVKQLLKQKERLVYIDNGLDEVIIRYCDIPDFIVDINRKLGINNLKIFDYQNISEVPLLTTFGEYLDRCNPEVRKDIIERLADLQIGKENVKPYKIIEENMLESVIEIMEKQKNRERDER